MHEIAYIHFRAGSNYNLMFGIFMSFQIYSLREVQRRYEKKGD